MNSKKNRNAINRYSNTASNTSGKNRVNGCKVVTNPINMDCSHAFSLFTHGIEYYRTKYKMRKLPTYNNPYKIVISNTGIPFIVWNDDVKIEVLNKYNTKSILKSCFTDMLNKRIRITIPNVKKHIANVLPNVELSDDVSLAIEINAFKHAHDLFKHGTLDNFELPKSEGGSIFNVNRLPKLGTWK